MAVSGFDILLMLKNVRAPPLAIYLVRRVSNSDTTTITTAAIIVAVVGDSTSMVVVLEMMLLVELVAEWLYC